MTRKTRPAWGQFRQQAPTGVPLIDELLKGGPGKGSMIYLAGPPGSGRSAMAARFLLNAKVGLWVGIDGVEPGLPPESLRELEARRAIGSIDVIALETSDTPPFADQANILSTLRPDRVVVWGADILELSNPTLLMSLLHALRNTTATALLTGTTASFSSDPQFATSRVLSYAENVILTQTHFEMSGTTLLARVIKSTPPVPTTAATRYRYDPSGITILEPGIEATPPPVANRKKVIVVPELFYLNSNHQKLVRTQLEQINRVFPHNDFITHGPPFANSVQYNAQLEEVKAGRQRWDLFIVDICRLREMIDHNLIQPLDNFLPQGWEDSYLKVAVDQCRVNGRIWALPHWINIGILVYRQDLLNKYRLPVPATWYDLVETSARVLKGEKNSRLSGFGFQGAQVEALTCNFLEFLLGNNGSVYDSSLHVKLTAPESVDALQFMCDLIHLHKTSPAPTPTFTETHTQRMFLEHQLLFTRSWPKLLKELPQTFTSPSDQVSVSQLPTLAQGAASRGVIGGFCYVIGRQVADPELLIEYHSAFYNPAMIKRLAREGSMCSPYRSVYDDAELLATHSHLSTIPGLLESGLSRGAIPHYIKLTEVLQREVNAALRQVKSPADALATVAEDLHKHIFRHHREQRLTRAIEYVEQNLHEEICRDKAAQACHLAPSYFSAIFSDVVGSSFTRYVSERRIDKARDLLERSGLTIAEVGQKVGFKDQSYFCQVFRQHTNMTPSEYRLNVMTNASHH